MKYGNLLSLVVIGLLASACGSERSTPAADGSANGSARPAQAATSGSGTASSNGANDSVSSDAVASNAQSYSTLLLADSSTNQSAVATGGPVQTALKPLLDKGPCAGVAPAPVPGQPPSAADKSAVQACLAAKATAVQAFMKVMAPVMAACVLDPKVEGEKLGLPAPQEQGSGQGPGNGNPPPPGNGNPPPRGGMLPPPAPNLSAAQQAQLDADLQAQVDSSACAAAISAASASL